MTELRMFPHKEVILKPGLFFKRMPFHGILTCFQICILMKDKPMYFQVAIEIMDTLDQILKLPAVVVVNSNATDR